MENFSNLRLWEREGENLLIIQPFMDSLIVRGEGCYLIDAEGRRILDLAAGQFCSILGHSHRGFIRCMQQQMEKIWHLGDQYVSPGILKAAARLAGIAPSNLKKVIFLSTGSEANECAMRIAKAVTGRTGMLAFTRGYYGISLATRSLSSISDYPGKVDFQPAPINQLKILTPTCQRCPIGLEYPSCGSTCLEVSLEMVAQQLENVAAVILEPVVSAGGMIFPPKDYLQKLYAKSRSIGALFIVDEAQTGFGRCGKWFDIQHAEIEPDILVVSKTAGNGYPAAAVVVSDEVARSLEVQGFTHLSSHQNDPLAAAAVHAVIDIVEEEGLIKHSREMGSYFVDGLKALQQKHPIILDVRGRGLMIGLELSDRFQLERGINLGLTLAMLCELKGLHITFSYYEPVVRFIPPLIISKEEIDVAIVVLDEALDIIEKSSENLSGLLPQNPRSGPFLKRMMKEGFSPIMLIHKMWNTSPRQWVDKIKRTI
jgi:2,2-dialkylglycine decarboxylase (pyruvate)